MMIWGPGRGVRTGTDTWPRHSGRGRIAGPGELRVTLGGDMAMPRRGVVDGCRGRRDSSEAPWKAVWGLRTGPEWLVEDHIPPAAPSWSTTRSTWHTPAPRRTSTWSSPPTALWPSAPGTAGAEDVSRGHHGFGKDWIGGTWDLTLVGVCGLGTLVLGPQGTAVGAAGEWGPRAPAFPQIRSFSVLSSSIPPQPPFSLSWCLCPSLCLQTLSSILHFGVRTSGVWRRRSSRDG